LAKAIGYRQSAISNMLKAERNISVITHTNGRIELLEEKIIGPALQNSA
jgi:Asp/Glu/hydantoin racemase